MKSTKKLLLLASVAIFSSGALFAQSLESGNKAKNNWFISIGGGANVYQGEQDDEAPFGDRIGWSGELSIGKWFSPVVGSRIQLYGGQAKGWNFAISQQGYYLGENRFKVGEDWEQLYKPSDLTWIGQPTVNPTTGETYPGDMFQQPLKHISASIDVMFNLNNLFRGYYKENAVDFIPFIGIGYMQSFAGDANPKLNGLLGKAGLRTNFNVVKNLSIFLELQADLLDKEMDGYVGNRTFDGMFSAMAGVSFAINKNFTTPVDAMSQAEIDRLNASLNDLQNEVYSLQEKTQNLERRGNVAPTVEKVIIKESGKDELYMPEYIRFPLSSSEILGDEISKLDMAVQYLKATPKSKVLLIGYADKKTGNPTLNMKLSEQRVRSVFRYLRDRGIAESRIITEWKGDREQPYRDNEWNRVVIMVER